MFKKLYDQNRLARFIVQLKKSPGGLVRELTFGLVEKQSVNVLDGRRLQIEQLHGGLHGIGY